MRSPLWRSSVVALVICLLPGCTLWPKFLHKRRAAGTENLPPTAKAAQLVGTIVLINIEGGFVLIDNGTQSGPAIGTNAQSRSPDGSSAELRVTEIRKRPFVIADIVGGTPQKGDPVFQ